MAYFVITDFSRGRDLRRSQETSPSGTFRILRNAFINEGGEVEKRRAWVLQEDMTAYAQDPLRKGRVVGPIRCPIDPDAVFFRHRGNTLPGSPFTAGPSGDTAYLDVTETGAAGARRRFWVQRSNIAFPGSASLLRAHVQGQYGTAAYVVESYVDPADRQMRYQHVHVPHVADEPDSEALIAANADRPAQLILSQKSYVAENNTLYSSALGDPTDMAGTGAWTIDVTTQSLAIGPARALGEYFGQLVLFGQKGAMFWQVDPDPDQNQYLRSIETALFAPRTVTPYGDGDVLFLTRGGVRSLQARDSSSEARISDVGSPIDTEIRRLLDLDTDDAEPLFGALTGNVNNGLFYNTAGGIVHPDTGQFMLALRDEVHVLTRYPAAKVLAWASYALPELQADSEFGPNGTIKGRWVADWCTIGDTIAMRNFADEIYVYGGDTGADYDSSQVEAILPFMDFGRPGSEKRFRGISISCEGEWGVQFATVGMPDDRNIQWQDLGLVRGSTKSGPRIPLDARGSQIAIRLTSQHSGKARLSELVIHYDEAGQK